MEKADLIFKDFALENNPNTPENLAKTEELHAIYTQAYNIDTADDFADFADMLKSKYPDYKTYRLYHIIAGSTINPEMGIKVDKFDFPNNEVEHFLLKMKNRALLN